jgi:hypothetical protein
MGPLYTHAFSVSPVGSAVWLPRVFSPLNGGKSIRTKPQSTFSRFAVSGGNREERSDMAHVFPFKTFRFRYSDHSSQATNRRFLLLCRGGVSRSAAGWLHRDSRSGQHRSRCHHIRAGHRSPVPMENVRGPEFMSLLGKCPYPSRDCGRRPGQTRRFLVSELLQNRLRVR